MELVTAMLVAAIGVSVAIPTWSRYRARERLRAEAALLAGAIREARTVATSGATGLDGWAPTDRVKAAGLNLAATEYEVYADRDREADGVGEVVVRYRILPTTLRLDSAVDGVRIARDGTLVDDEEIEVVVTDTESSNALYVRVGFGGHVEVSP